MSAANPAEAGMIHRRSFFSARVGAVQKYSWSVARCFGNFLNVFCGSSPGASSYGGACRQRVNHGACCPDELGGGLGFPALGVCACAEVNASASVSTVTPTLVLTFRAP